jgi:signal transduction histidine kinase
MVVHELRTPVEVGRGRAELAAAESADPETLDAIVASFDRISDVLDAVLSLVHADVDPDDATPRDLGATARDAWSDLNDAADATLAVASSRPVVADHDLLDRLFSNLFRNALEHAGPDPTVRVAVTDAPETTDGDALTPGEIGFAVSDDGLGIPPEDRDRVFEPGESETGTGFGLAIVDRIAAAHGWTARVTESEDGGARFEFVPDS